LTRSIAIVVEKVVQRRMRRGVVSWRRFWWMRASIEQRIGMEIRTAVVVEDMVVRLGGLLRSYMSASGSV
jgi:hypothetical protein